MLSQVRLLTVLGLFSTDFGLLSTDFGPFVIEQAASSGLVGPSSPQMQHLLFKVMLVEKEVCLLENSLRRCPDMTVLGDVRSQDPVDTLLAWVNHHLKAAASKRRLQQWNTDLYDSEIFAVLVDQLNLPHVDGAVATPLSLLFETTNTPPPPSPIGGSEKMAAQLKSKRTQADKATLIARHLEQWKDGQGNPGGVVLRAAYIFGQEGPLGDAGKLQFALARMFLLRAALPPAGIVPEWSRKIESLRTNLTQLRAEEVGIRSARRGWCSAGAVARLGQMARDIEGALEVERKELHSLQKGWQRATEKVGAFAYGLAMAESGTNSAQTPEASQGGDATDGSIRGVDLHASLKEGLGMIGSAPSTGDLWGATDEQKDREVGRVGAQVWSVQCMLLQAFRMYSSRTTGGSGAAVVSADDWRRFVDDCRVPDAALSDKRAQVRDVFEHFKMWELRKPGANRANTVGDEFCFRFFDFAMAVVELAGRVLAAEIKRPSDMLLSQRFGIFLERHVSAYVPRSDSAALALFVDSNLVRQFFSENRKELRSIYLMFAKADGSDLKNGRLKVINAKEFAELIAVCKLDKTAGMSVLRTRKLFVDVQGLTKAASVAEQIEMTIAASPGLSVASAAIRSPPVSAVVFALCGEGCSVAFGAAATPISPRDALSLAIGAQLGFDDFCLAVCMLALARYADAMLPMHHKLAEFWSADFMPARKAKKVDLK